MLNGLPSQIAYELGLWDIDNPPPVSYHSVCDQKQRLEEALGAKWTEEIEAIFDLDWICHTFVKATVPRRFRRMITACSIDAKVLESWGVSKTFVKEKDALAEHELAARDKADLAEPELPTVNGPFTYEIGTFGPDKRMIRSHDPDARLTYKTATNREKARIVLGYDFHLLTAVPGAKWTGDPRKLAFLKAPPKFILAMALVPGATNPGLVALDLVDRALDIRARDQRHSLGPRLHQQARNLLPRPPQAGNGHGDGIQPR